MKGQQKSRRIIFCIGVLWICSVAKGDNIPEWWVARGVVNTQLPPSDYSVVNLGQLKHVAFQAWVEMTNQLAQVVTNFNETDPTVLASVKDGVDWTELTGVPTEIADGDAVDDADASVSNELNTALSFNSTNNLLELTDNGGTLSADLSDLVDVESDPVWVAEKTNYSTTAEVDALYVSKTGDAITGSLSIASNLVVGTGTASGLYAVAEGTNTLASGSYSHAEGEYTVASGSASHAEGSGTTAGFRAHAEGDSTTAGGWASHAEGWLTQAGGPFGHAEGANTRASGQSSHAEGVDTIASGWPSHAEGSGTTASGKYTHAAGRYARATHDSTYVWSDGTTIGSTTTNQYTVYAQNGIRLLGGPISGDGSGLTNLNAVTTETDPTVLASVKDGVDWTELTGIPAEIADGDAVDDADASVNNELNTALSFNSTNSLLELTDNGGILSADLSNLVDVETDPQVGANSTNYLSKWDGSALVSGAIYDDGNVGIGTMSPGAKLEISGDLKFSSGGNRNIDGPTSSSLFIKSYPSASNEGIRFFTGALGNTEAIRIVQNGNLGIGTTSPSEKLDVTGTVKATAFVGDGSGLTGISGGSGDGHSLDAADGSPTDTVYVDNSGKVGIGTTAPSTDLDVSGMVRTTGWTHPANGSGPGLELSYDAVNNRSLIQSFSRGPTFENVDLAITGEDLTFFTKTGNVNAVERMCITSDGNIGIGTTNPVEKLDVDGTVKAMAFVGDGSGLTNLAVESRISQVESQTNSWDSTASDLGLLTLDVQTNTATLADYATRISNLDSQTNDWNTAYDWGDHATSGYLTSYTETDPTWTGVSNDYSTTTEATGLYVSKAGGTITGDLTIQSNLIVGIGNIASGLYATAFGTNTLASEDYSHAEGKYTIASASASHAEGSFTEADGYASHAEGFATTATTDSAHAEGEDTIASGYASHAEGNSTIASNDSSHAEGKYTLAGGYASHAEGYTNRALGYASHAEGYGTAATNDSSHAEGEYTLAGGYASHAEGYGTTATNDSSHAEGEYTLAGGYASHAEGYSTIASGYAGHAEGFATTASGSSSHAAGANANATNNNTYVWSDGNPIGSTTTNQYTVYAQNGIRLYGTVYHNDGAVHTSDRRLKKNIQPIPNALGKIDQINGVYYEMIKNPEVTKVGVIAQEVEAVLPEVVVDNPEGYKSVDYSKLTALLIEALKDLRTEKDAQIAELTQRLETLENQ